MQTKTRINWLITSFFIVVSILALAGIVMLAMNLVAAKTIIMAAIMTLLGGFSVTAGYHRLFAHKTYKAAWPVRLIFLLAGASSFEGSVLEWSTDHRDHHRFTDTEQDPYNIKQGFWHAHMGWIFTLDESRRRYDNVEDLMRDPLIVFQHKYYSYLAIFTGFILPMLIAGMWGDWLGGFLVGGALRITIGHQMTFCINSVCHYFGKQTYSEKYSARDNWFTALFTLGEGFHNFHHRFPIDYRNGVRFYDFDPTKWLIKTLYYFGLAKDLRKIKAQRILESKLEMDHVRLKACEKSSAAYKQKFQEIYDSIINTLKHLDEISQNNFDSKSKKSEKQRLKSHLKSLLKNWKQLNKESSRALA